MFFSKIQIKCQIKLKRNIKENLSQVGNKKGAE